jgi:hypothetical protein
MKPVVPNYAVIQAVRQHHSELAHAANIRALYAARLGMIAANNVLETSAMPRYERIIERIVTGGAR